MLVKAAAVRPLQPSAPQEGTAKVYLSMRKRQDTLGMRHNEAGAHAGHCKHTTPEAHRAPREGYIRCTPQIRVQGHRIGQHHPSKRGDCLLAVCRNDALGALPVPRPLSLAVVELFASVWSVPCLQQHACPKVLP